MKTLKESHFWETSTPHRALLRKWLSSVTEIGAPLLNKESLRPAFFACLRLGHQL
jgi:hypothetical protein